MTADTPFGDGDGDDEASSMDCEEVDVPSCEDKNAGAGAAHGKVEHTHFVIAS
jgi:hypothetical protein